MLKRTQDRKTTNLTTPNGKQSKIANTFALPAGKDFSCPGATSVCESICYAGKLEKIFKGFRENITHNWELLKDADQATMYGLLKDMIDDFRRDCDKWGSQKLFRIHSDGDFFNEKYAAAWRDVILENTDIQFWVYTRSAFAVPMLTGLPNLGLYFSADSANIKLAMQLKREHGVQVAFLAKNFAAGQEVIKAETGRPGAKCPENKGAIPLISTEGSACVRCSLCIYQKTDVVFSASKS